MAIYIFSGEPDAHVKQAIIDDYYVPPPPWLCFTAQQANSTIHLDKYKSPDPISLETSADGNTWSDYTWSGTTGATITLVNVDDKVYFRAKNENQTISKTYINYYTFVMTGKIAASGNIQTLLKADGSRTDVPAYCYESMFKDCTSLTTAPKLPATTLAEYCYDSMFYNCTSLTAAPATLPATTLAEYCYKTMFTDCTSLTTAPELPATTLAAHCYYNMFLDCTSLTIVPSLPATTLASSCYDSMFRGCSSMTTAPSLPATTLASSCYDSMFRGCTYLASMNVNFTAWNPSNATVYWMRDTGSQASGTKTFTCPSSLPNTTGDNNIPSGWTRVDK